LTDTLYFCMIISGLEEDLNAMEWRKRSRNMDEWKRKFAFFPTRVGTDSNGKEVWVCFCLYQQKMPNGRDIYRRPINRPDITEYFEPFDPGPP